jgi:hypothetical protein
VDSRFVLKVTDFGLMSLRLLEETTAEDVESHAFYRSKPIKELKIKTLNI